jgi:hypothetical protein
METLQILYTFIYEYRVGPSFAFNTAAILLGIDSYKFWTVSSGSLYHSSWRTSSSRFRDVGGGNLFLTLVSKTDQNGSMTFKSGDCAGQGRCWSSPSCSWNHDWTVPSVWMRVLETASLFGNNVWIMGWVHLIIQPVYVLPCSNSAVKGNNGANRIQYHDIAAQTITEPSPCFTVGTRNSGLQVSLGVLQS